MGCKAGGLNKAGLDKPHDSCLKLHHVAASNLRDLPTTPGCCIMNICIYLLILYYIYSVLSIHIMVQLLSLVPCCSRFHTSEATVPVLAALKGWRTEPGRGWSHIHVCYTVIHKQIICMRHIVDCIVKVTNVCIQYIVHMLYVQCFRKGSFCHWTCANLMQVWLRPLYV